MPFAESAPVKTPDSFWLKDESLSESENLPDPDVLAQEIVDDPEAALEQFRETVVDLAPERPETPVDHA